MAGTIFRFLKLRVVIAFGSFLLGLLLMLGVGVMAYHTPKPIHFHANFAVYINGQREPFKALNYYEEEAATSCSTAETLATAATAMSRVHMHNNINDVVHVEDSRVTWGNFFTVLGWNVGRNYIATRDTVYQNNTQGTVTYILNGNRIDDIANTIIGDQDKLLVNYGDQSTDEIQQEYAQIQNKALQADQAKDPTGCGGANTNSMTLGGWLPYML